MQSVLNKFKGGRPVYKRAVLDSDDDDDDGDGGDDDDDDDDDDGSLLTYSGTRWEVKRGEDYVRSP